LASSQRRDTHRSVLKSRQLRAQTILRLDWLVEATETLSRREGFSSFKTVNLLFSNTSPRKLHIAPGIVKQRLSQQQQQQQQQSTAEARRSHAGTSANELQRGRFRLTKPSCWAAARRGESGLECGVRIRPSSHDVWRCAGAVRLPKRRGLNGRFKCRTQGATFISTAAVSHIPELYFKQGLAFRFACPCRRAMLGATAL
jgi:hypothetical protein